MFKIIAITIMLSGCFMSYPESVASENAVASWGAPCKSATDGLAACSVADQGGVCISDACHPLCMSGDQYCPTGWFPSFEWTYSHGGCYCEHSNWPPQVDGSRDVPSACPISDGHYKIAWEHGNNGPSFAFTTEMIIDGTMMNLNYTTSSGVRTLDYNYSIIWVDAGTAYVVDDERTLDWEMYGDCPSGVHGFQTVNLPYLNYENGQVQTFKFTAVPK